MVQFKPPKLLSSDSRSERLPTEHDLPDTDNRPVDNELQLLIPILLRGILELAWCDRPDWFFGANMGVYYDPKKPAVGPDGFLCMGAPHYREGKDLRLSYLLWQEKVVPQWVLEIVSKKPGKEYDEKMKLYARLGVLYYVIYNPQYQKRDKHDTFEVYRLTEGEYVRQQGNPVWMPELGLGLGVTTGKEGMLPVRDWLYWYDERGRQYPTQYSLLEQRQRQIDREQQKVEQAEQRARQAEQKAEQERQKAEQERQKAEQERQKAEQERQQLESLLEKLRDRNIDPDSL